MKRVGIYSGTFDPVHDGHIAFAREAIKQCGLDKVFFLVEPRPRRKQGVKALEHRAEMVRRAIRHESNLGMIVLEQQRFTVEKTLPVLRSRFASAKIYMLMGDDMLVHFAEWPHVDELIQNIKFAIGQRKYQADDVMLRISSIQQARGFNMDYQLFEAPQAQYSSSKIKQQLKRGKVPEGLQASVLAYIQKEKLYTASSKRS